MRAARFLLVALVVAGLAGPAPAAAGQPGEPAGTGGKECGQEHAEATRTASVSAADRVSATNYFSVAPCNGVRPGAPIIVGNSGCTANFIYQGVDARKRVTTYLGTAGHCVLPGDNGFAADVGERTYAPGKGQKVTLLDGTRIGEIAYAVHQNSKDLDFALIRIDPKVKVDPQMCHFGGPTGINNTRGGGTQLHLVGDGAVVGWVVPARTFYATSLANPKAVTAVGAAIMGDSGGPIIDDRGRAVGVLVGLGARWNLNRNEAGFIEILRLPHLLSRAEQVLKQRITMRTAKLR